MTPLAAAAAATGWFLVSLYVIILLTVVSFVGLLLAGLIVSAFRGAMRSTRPAKTIIARSEVDRG